MDTVERKKRGTHQPFQWLSVYEERLGVTDVVCCCRRKSRLQTDLRTNADDLLGQDSFGKRRPDEGNAKPRGVRPAALSMNFFLGEANEGKDSRSFRLVLSSLSVQDTAVPTACSRGAHVCFGTRDLQDTSCHFLLGWMCSYS